MHSPLTAVASALAAVAFAACGDSTPAPRSGADGSSAKSTPQRTLQSPLPPAADLASAQQTASEDDGLRPSVDDAGHPRIPQYSTYVLGMPEVKGVVPWKTLAKVEVVAQAGKLAPKFAGDVRVLQSKDVKLQGFMLPIEVGEKHSRFLLAALPPSCAFCLPGGAESIVEVRAQTPVKFTMEPVVLAGKFAVLSDDATGLYYRLTEARLSAPG
jgi:hypothetical protein